MHSETLKLVSYDSCNRGVLGYFELETEFSGLQGFKDTVFTSNMFCYSYYSARVFAS